MDLLEVNEPEQPIISLDAEPTAIVWLNKLNRAIYATEYIGCYVYACVCIIDWKQPLQPYPTPFNVIINNLTNVLGDYDPVVYSFSCPNYLKALIRDLRDSLPRQGEVNYKIVNNARNVCDNLHRVLIEEYTRKQEEFRTGEFSSQWQSLEKRYKTLRQTRTTCK